MQCEPATGAGRVGAVASFNLVVGSQHRFVRMANAAPVIEGGVWSADVTVQNLTLQPMATLDGAQGEAEGVRVFFVEEPNNGVEVINHDDEGAFTGSEPQKYYAYSAALLGEDAILTPGETSGAKRWQFALNGATEFQFSVLIWTRVPDPGAYSVHLTRLAAGVYHTCGESSDDKIYCWGANGSGRLGDGSTLDRSTPVAVQIPAGVTLSGVSAGGAHTCANASNGSVYCWGSNSFGQVGDGTTSARNTPVAVQAPAGVALSGVSAGGNHTCANGSDGKVYCWGYNSLGQVGDSTNTTRYTPVAVKAPEGVSLSGVAAGAGHSCAEGSNGQLYCWGSNNSGRLGDGTNTNSPAPVAVLAPSGVTLTGVSTRDNFTCAQGSDGKVYCWGNNVAGRLGDGTTTEHWTPVAVQAPAGVSLSAVSAGSGHACANGSNGKVYCWGTGLFGRIGNGSTGNSLIPAAVSVSEGVTLSGVTSGGYHSCAVSAAGPAYCWGQSQWGRLGDGRTSDSSVPVFVAGTH